MNGVAHAALGIVGGNLTEAEVSYKEGVADFNGNYQIPADGEKYYLVNVETKSGAKISRYMGVV